MHFLILAMLASFLAPSMVFACTNNLVPEVDVPATVSSPDGGFAFTTEPGYPVAVKIDGEWVDGGISTPFEDDEAPTHNVLGPSGHRTNHSQMVSIN